MPQFSRRDFLKAGVAATLLSGVAKASQPATPVNFAIPAKACDCHTHIFGNPSQFPLWAGRAYTPETALPEEMAALHRALHLDRVVIVTPSVYAADNSATIYGMKIYGMKPRGGNARGVAVIDENTRESDLDAMGAAGIRGIRLNLATAGRIDPATGRERLRAALDRVARRRWHIQIFTNLPMISALSDLVRDSPAPVVFDHFGGAQASLGLAQPGFADLVALVRSGKAYVKISGVYRCSTEAPDYADMAPFAKALIAANAERVIWGTDWPHPDSVTPAGHRPTDVTPLLSIDDGRLLNQLPVWAPDPAIRKTILVDNPARLYGF